MTKAHPTTVYTVRTPAQLPALLQGFRKASGLTQAELAARLGMTQQTLSTMERNAQNVSTARLLKLLQVLGVEMVLRTAPDEPPASKAGKDVW